MAEIARKQKKAAELKERAEEAERKAKLAQDDEETKQKAEEAAAAAQAQAESVQNEVDSLLDEVEDKNSHLNQAIEQEYDEKQKKLDDVSLKIQNEVKKVTTVGRRRKAGTYQHLDADLDPKLEKYL